MTLLDVFCHPSRWTQGAYARDGRGLPCWSLSPHARAWDLEAAMILVYRQRAAEMRAAARILVKNPSLGAWNDDPDRTFRDIVNLARLFS